MTPLKRLTTALALAFGMSAAYASDQLECVAPDAGSLTTQVMMNALDKQYGAIDAIAAASPAAAAVADAFSQKHDAEHKANPMDMCGPQQANLTRLMLEAAEVLEEMNKVAPQETQAVLEILSQGAATPSVQNMSVPHSVIPKTPSVRF